MAGGVVGIVGGVLTVSLGAPTAMFADEGDSDTAIPLGGVTLLVAGITTPITAAGAASARRHPEVRGAIGARIAGWIGYGVTMLDGMVLLGLGMADEEVTGAQVGSVVLLSTLSTTAMVVDAFVSASQARRLSGPQQPLPTAEQKPLLVPLVAAAPDFQGGAGLTLGLQGRF